MLRNNNKTEYYRRKISILRNRINNCNGLKNKTKKFVEELNKKYDSNAISYNKYVRALNETFKNKSPNDWIVYYDNNIKGYQQRIDQYNNKLLQFNKVEVKREHLAILMIILISISAFVFFRFGGVTGLTTFAESVSHTDVLNLTILEDQEYDWSLRYPGEINSILASGKIIGRGHVKIYIEYKDQLFLIYEKENDQSKFEFDRECIETCLLPDLKSGNYKLVFGVDEADLVLDSLSYLRFELIDISLEPKQTVVEFEPHLFKTYELNVMNKEKKDFEVAMFVEGELNNSITLYNSTLYLSSKDEFKTIKYDLDLPSKLEPGIHKAKILVKYLPNKEFTGSTPSEEHEIYVIVPFEGKKLEADLLNYFSNNSINFEIPLYNIGTENIQEVKASIEIYKFEDKITTLETNKVSLNKNNKLEAKWTPNVKTGKYKALVIITYDDKEHIIEREFDVNTIVSIEDINIEERGGESYLSIKLKNNINEQVSGVFGEIFISSCCNINMKEFGTNIINLEPNSEGELTAFLDIENLPSGEYDVRVVVNSVTKQEKLIKINKDVLKEEIIHKEEPRKEKKDSTYKLIIVMMALLVLTTLIWLLNLLHLKKRK